MVEHIIGNDEVESSILSSGTIPFTGIILFGALNMFKNLTQLYCLAVCFVTALISIVTIALIINSSLDIAMGETRYSWGMLRFQSNEQYLQSLPLNEQNRLNEKDWEQLTQKRLAAKVLYISERNTQNVSSIISHSVWLVISAIAFIIHWRLNKKYTN